MLATLIRAFVLIATTLPAFADGQKFVLRTEIGERWPLTVDSGILGCNAHALTFEHKGVRYAVNGVATGRKVGRDLDPIWAPADPMWIIDPKTKKKVNVAPPKKHIGALIDAGLKLCSK